jgi:hypothetical protein
MSVRGHQAHRAPAEVVREGIQLAARSIDVRNQLDRAYLSAVTSDTSGDVAKAWLNFRRVGEIRFSVMRSARIAGYAQLRAVKVNSQNEIVQEKASGVEAEVVGGITSRYGGTRGLIERYYSLMKVPGQSFLTGLQAANDVPDGYWFWSASEIASEADPGTLAKDGKPITARLARFGTSNGERGAFTYQIQPDDFYGRIWAPDPEFVEDSFSPMQAIAGMCEQLSDLRDSISARLRSRFAHSGILLIPNEIQDAAISGDKPRDGLYSADKVMNYLIHVMTTNVTNHAQGLAAMPILLKGPAAVLDKVAHIIEEATIADTDLKLRAELIEGILMALDQQKQAVNGGEGTNHWGMWAVSDEERRITVQPDLDSMCHGLTRLVLWPALANRGKKGRTAADIMQWRVWYDLSKASVRANADEDARQLADRGAVSLAYLRLLSGVPETAAPSPTEYVQQLGWAMKNPILATHGLDGIEVDWDKASAWGQAPGPDPNSPADDQEVGPGAGDPGSPDDRDSDTPKSKEPG